MKPTFREVASSDAYQRQANAVSKGHVFVATITALIAMLATDVQLGYWWLLVFPVIWFGSSILIALPFMLIKIKVGLQIAKSPRQASIISSIFDIISLCCTAIAVYYFIRWLDDFIFHL